MQPHLGKQKTVCWYYPPEIDYRLSLLPENSKGLILWLIEAKVMKNKVSISCCWGSLDFGNEKAFKNGFFEAVWKC